MLLLTACGPRQEPDERWAATRELPVRAEFGEWPADSIPGYVTLRLAQPAPAPLLLMLQVKFGAGPVKPLSPVEPMGGVYRIDFDWEALAINDRTPPGRVSGEAFFAAYVPGQRAEVPRHTPVPLAGGLCLLEQHDAVCRFNGSRPDLLEFVRDPRLPASGPRFRLAPREETDSILLGRQPIIVQAWREVGVYRARFDTRSE